LDSNQLRFIERLTRQADEMLYEVTVEDPEVLAKPWVSVRWNITDIEKASRPGRFSLFISILVRAECLAATRCIGDLRPGISEISSRMTTSVSTPVSQPCSNARIAP